jgi:hypothetical protein
LREGREQAKGAGPVESLQAPVRAELVVHVPQATLSADEISRLVP